MKPTRKIIEGEIPSPINIPSGCSFNSRCPEKMEICQQEDPKMIEITKGHFVRCHLFNKN